MPSANTVQSLTFTCSVVLCGLASATAGCTGRASSVSPLVETGNPGDLCDQSVAGVYGAEDVFPTTEDISFEEVVANLSGEDCAWESAAGAQPTSTSFMRLQLVSDNNTVVVTENGDECYPVARIDVLIKFDSEFGGGLVLPFGLILREGRTLGDAGHADIPADALSGVEIPDDVELVDFWIKYRGESPEGPGDWQIGVTSAHTAQQIVSGSCMVAN